MSKGVKTKNFLNLGRALPVLGAVLALSGAGALVSPPAAAQAFPSRPITVIMPIAASTAFYITMREMADQIQAKAGRPIVFDQQIGASGMLGPARVKRSEADGHTIGLSWAAPLSLNVLFPNPQYDPLKDLAYISMLTRHGIYFTAGAHVPANTLQELVALAKAKPESVKIAQAATGSLVGILQLQEAAGVKFLIVPYKSSAQGEVAAMSGEVDMVATTAGTAREHVRAGKMKGIFIFHRTDI